MTFWTFIRANVLCRGVAVAAGALGFASVHAAGRDPLDPVQSDEITVSAPSARTVARTATGARLQEVTVAALVRADPVALTTKYGALMLEYSVREAARQVCDEADPFMEDGGACFQKALASAKPQMDEAIAQARNNHQS